MYLQMVGLDAQVASIAQREVFSFSTETQETILKALQTQSGIAGAVLLVTCNRTELYLSSEKICAPESYLLQFSETEDSTVFYKKTGQDAALHLMEVACGLHSQVLHEEQIVTQINQAIGMARAHHTADALLDTVFRTAVSAGKYALTHVSDRTLPLSLSEQAVQRVAAQYETLSGKTCLVIGNGKMGQLAAEQLVQRECHVFITLRHCHHGNSVVPFGTQPVPYESRFSYLEQADIVISATRSPHYTINATQLQALQHKPQYLIDLAMPRDIAADCKQVAGVCCWNLDDLSDNTQQQTALRQSLQDIAEKYAEEFQVWSNYRDAVPHIQDLKQLIAANLLHSTTMDTVREQNDTDAAITTAVARTVDLLLGGMKEVVTAELVEGCYEKIAARSRLPKKKTEETV